MKIKRECCKTDCFAFVEDKDRSTTEIVYAECSGLNSLFCVNENCKFYKNIHAYADEVNRCKERAFALHKRNADGEYVDKKGRTSLL